jgi:hypothetical protein
MNNEALLSIVIERLEYEQGCRFSGRRSHAIARLKEALQYLKQQELVERARASPIE